VATGGPALALGGALPNPVLRARPVAGRYLLAGTSPWVTGWGMIDTLATVARIADDRQVTALLDVQAGPTLAAEQLALMAVNASRTVELCFGDHFVPADRVVEMISYRDWLAGDARGLRMNGSLSFGVAARCCALDALGAGAAPGAWEGGRAGAAQEAEATDDGALVDPFRGVWPGRQLVLPVAAPSSGRSPGGCCCTGLRAAQGRRPVPQGALSRVLGYWPAAVTRAGSARGGGGGGFRRGTGRGRWCRCGRGGRSR
jgi:hypothetical protein